MMMQLATATEMNAAACANMEERRAAAKAAVLLPLIQQVSAVVRHTGTSVKVAPVRLLVCRRRATQNNAATAAG